MKIFRDTTNQDIFTDGMEWKGADNWEDFMYNDIPAQGRTWKSSPLIKMVPVWHGQKCKIWLKFIKFSLSKTSKVSFYFVKLQDLVCNTCLLYNYHYFFISRYILYGNLPLAESNARRNDGVKYIILHLLRFTLCTCSDL